MCVRVSLSLAVCVCGCRQNSPRPITVGRQTSPTRLGWYTVTGGIGTKLLFGPQLVFGSSEPRAMRPVAVPGRPHDRLSSDVPARGEKVQENKRSADDVVLSQPRIGSGSRHSTPSPPSNQKIGNVQQSSVVDLNAQVLKKVFQWKEIRLVCASIRFSSV